MGKQERPQGNPVDYCMHVLGNNWLHLQYLQGFFLQDVPFFFTVQHECIPQAILGMDIICQAKSGMGKTAVFVLATLQQLEQIDGQVSVLVMCHTRELAFQISKEYERFSKYMNNIKVSVFFGGISIKKDQQTLKTNCPHIVVGTPGRILALAREKSLNLKHIKHFILDECDKMLEQLGKCYKPSLSSSSLEL